MLQFHAEAPDTPLDVWLMDLHCEKCPQLREVVYMHLAKII
jgi:hypothetical protein